MSWRDDTDVVGADPLLDAVRELHAAAAAHDLAAVLLTYDRVSAWIVLRYGRVRPHEYDDEAGEQPGQDPGRSPGEAPAVSTATVALFHEA